MRFGSTEEEIEYMTQNVSRYSRPSDLEITDLRVAVIDDIPFKVPLVRIDTNQGISGYGEVRDGGDKRYALMLKSRLLGRDPTNVEQLFKRIRQFGGHGRQGGGLRASRRPSGTWRARPTGCPSTRCWAASTATGCASTPTRPVRTIPTSSPAGCSGRGWIGDTRR
jgi:hypothetical protein